MGNKKINELSVRTPTINDLMLIGDSSTGYSYQTTVGIIATFLGGTISLNDLSDVSLSSPTNGQVLQYNGSAWVNASVTSGVSGSGSINRIPVWTGATTLGDSLITSSSSSAPNPSQNLVSYVAGNNGFFIDPSTAIFGIHSDSVGVEVNLSNGDVRVGDPSGLFGNNAYIYISQTSNYITAFGGGDKGLKLDFGNNRYWLGDGDPFFSNSGTALVVDDDGETIYTQWQGLPFGLQTYTDVIKIGDYDSNWNYTHIAIYDQFSRIEFNTSNFIISTLPSATTSNVLYYDTTTGAVSYGIGGGGGGVSGSGTTNYLPKWTGTTTLGNSLIQDNGTQIGYGTSPNASYSHLFNSVATITNFNTGTNGRIKIQSTSASSTDGVVLCPFSNFIFGSNVVYTQPIWTYEKTGYAVSIQMEAQVNGAMYFQTAGLGSAGGLLTLQNRLAILNTGVVGVNKTVASTYILDVQGVTNGLRVTGSGTTGSTTGFKVETSGGIGNFVVLDNGNCGVRTSSPSARMHIATAGATTSSLGLKVRNSADSIDVLTTFGTTQVIINSNSASLESSAQLQIDSTDRGLLVPRMTNAEILAIVTPADGLQVYNTTISHMCIYQAGSWVKLNHSPM